MELKKWDHCKKIDQIWLLYNLIILSLYIVSLFLILYIAHIFYL